jgi:hypothetical protein
MQFKEECDKKCSHDENLRIPPDLLQKILNWRDSGTAYVDERNQLSGKHAERSQDDGTSVYGFALYASFAYKWLVGRIRLQGVCTVDMSPSMSQISETILNSLESLDQTRSAQSGSFTINMKMQWDPSQLLDDREYTPKAGDPLWSALTLTGDASQAQALTCSQYMAQTWPATGLSTLGFLKEAINHKDNHKGSMLFTENTFFDEICRHTSG